MARPTTKIGNVTRDPELKFSDKGIAYARFGLAVNNYDPKTKKITTEHPVFFDVVCFRTLAEHVAESLGKGDRAIVQGDGEVEEYNKEDGTKGKTNKILANHVGAELRFATATIQKATRTSPDLQEGGSTDPFAD